MQRVPRRLRANPTRIALAALAGVVALTGVALTASRGDAALPRLGGRIESLGVVRLDHPSPRQRPLLRVDLFAEQSVTRSLRWKLATTGRWGGTLENASGAGLIDFGHSFQNVDPSLQLDEAWVEWRGDDLDLRAGNQRFTWGTLDGPKPNDLLNPFRYYDPLISDENDLEIAVPAVALSWYFPAAWRERLPDDARVQLVWQPIAVPWLFPERDERWFPPAAETGDELFVPALPDVTPDPCPCTLRVEQELVSARRFDNGNLGFRVAGRTAGVDWSAMYFDGYDPAPSFTVPVRLALGDDPTTPGTFEATALTQLRPAYRRFRSIGADASRVFGPLTTRFEAAWRFRRPYPRDVRRLSEDILASPADVEALLAGRTVTLDAFVERDAVEWGMGADYAIGGWLPLVELYQVILLHNDTPLLIRDVDSRIATSVRKLWMSDRLETKLLGLWGIESGYEMVRFETTYAVSDALEIRAGVLGLWGNAFTLIGQFKKNSEAYARIRYSF